MFLRNQCSWPVQRSFNFQSREQNEKLNLSAKILPPPIATPKLFLGLLWLARKRLPCRLTSINKTSWLFVFVVHNLLCSNSIFGVQAEKCRPGGLIKLGPLQPLVCVRTPNLKIVPSMFSSAYLNVCFSFLKANALSIPSVLTCQLLLSFQRCWSY